jgi:hypothetical protein
MAEYRKIKPAGISGWRKMGSGSPGRQHIPSHVFLDKTKKRYPVKVWRGGKWQSSPKMELSAYRRAVQQKDKGIATKAAKLVNKRRRKSKTKQLVGGAKK